jgi:hypothetical protein
MTGIGFDAKQEAEALLEGLVTFDQLCSVIDVVQSIEETARGGFLAIKHKWEKTDHEDLFVYVNLGVAAAINVPGSGRAQTHDVSFIGIRVLAGGSDLNNFIREMLARRRAGTDHEWN